MAKMYSIRPGDTLNRLATFHGVSLTQLLTMNPQIENPNVINAGQLILVPDSGANPAPILAEENDPGSAPPWLKIARREEGVKEIVGPQHEMRVLEYLAVCSKTDPALRAKDETAWCSAFACWVMEQAGFQSPRSAWARSWFDGKWGDSEPLDNPRPGAIAVFSRGSGGHVGFFIEARGNKVRILGGNQSNSVREQDYPKDGRMGQFAYKLLGYRWPKGA